MAGTISGDATGRHFAALGNKLSKHPKVFVINPDRLVGAKAAHFAPVVIQPERNTLATSAISVLLISGRENGRNSARRVKLMRLKYRIMLPQKQVSLASVAQSDIHIILLQTSEDP